MKTIQVLLKATLTNSQGQRHDLLSWAHQDTSSSKREYEMFGLTFDPGDFRAKKEVRFVHSTKMFKDFINNILDTLFQIWNFCELNRQINATNAFFYGDLTF